MQLLKQLLGWGFVIGLGYILYTVAMQQRNTSIDFTISADNTSTFTGKVLVNNNSDCDSSSGGQCFLKVQSGNSEVYVIYDSGDNGFCKNEANAISSKLIHTDEVVKVYGFYKEDKTLHTINTCPSTDYYINKL